VGKDPEALLAALRHTRAMSPEGMPGPASLDFWLGVWTCTWDGGGGRNAITKELDGRVVVERFESHAPERWSGLSLSVFDEARGWRQTWVDSTGNYWAFHGDTHPDGFAFTANELEDGREVVKRMVFFDVEPDAFRWRWERSEDAGVTWELRWAIDYRRATRP
jgi:hypothetical protein